MSIKLIVTDMDGTLLNENIELTDNTVDAIKRAQAAGLEIAVATGRTIEAGYHDVIQAKGVSLPFMESNGARVFDEDDRLLITHALEKSDIKELIDIFEKYDVQHQFASPDKTYTTKSMEDFLVAWRAVFKSINPSMTDDELTVYINERYGGLDLEIVDNYDFLYQDTEIEVLKAGVNTDANIDVLAEIKAEVESRLNNVIVTSSSTHNLEINHKHANKGQAIADFAKERGYSPDEVITIGDSLNDLTMLKWATHSYAVENAHHEVKGVAKYIAPSYTKEPVAQIIDKVLTGENFTF